MNGGTSRLGRWMLALGWVAGIGVLALAFSLWIERNVNPNVQVRGATLADGRAEVVLRQNRAGHYVATGTIEGTPVVFLLDTGATSVSVPGSVAAEIGLERGAARPTRTANGTVTTYATRIGRVALGPIELENVRAHINPHMEGDAVLLGMSFLRGLELRQTDRELTIRAPIPGR